MRISAFLASLAFALTTCLLASPAQAASTTASYTSAEHITRYIWGNWFNYSRCVGYGQFDQEAIEAASIQINRSILILT